MSVKLLSPQELRVWHAFKLMGDDVLDRVGRNISEATGLSGSDFAVLSRLAAIGQGEMRQQALAECIGWDKSRLSHHLTRMQQRKLIERRDADKRTTLVVLTKHGRAKLDEARPVHAEAIRRHLLSRLTKEQTVSLVRISNILGDDEAED